MVRSFSVVDATGLSLNPVEDELFSPGPIARHDKHITLQYKSSKVRDLMYRSAVYSRLRIKYDRDALVVHLRERHYSVVMRASHQQNSRHRERIRTVALAASPSRTLQAPGDRCNLCGEDGWTGAPSR